MLLWILASIIFITIFATALYFRKQKHHHEKIVISPTKEIPKQKIPPPSLTFVDEARTGISLILPNEILISVFSFLHYHETFKLSQVCKLFHELCHSNLLWQMLYLRYFPAPLKHDGKDWKNEFFKNISKNLPQLTYRTQMKKSLEIDGLKVKAVRNSPMLTIAQSNSLLTFARFSPEIYYYEIKILNFSFDAKLIGVGFCDTLRPNPQNVMKKFVGVTGNGDFFCLGSENLQELMEFNVGDIIGVGNHATMGIIFFTKNGNLIPQFPTLKYYGPSFASVMLSRLGDQVEFNFGLYPFKFDIHSDKWLPPLELHEKQLRDAEIMRSRKLKSE